MAPAPRADWARNLKHITRFRGNMIHGYDNDDVNAVLGQISDVTGLTIVCVWEYYDDYGYGGDSRFCILSDNGTLYQQVGDLYPWLSGTPDDPHTPDSPGDPSTWIGPAEHITESAFVNGDGFHNYALADYQSRDDDDS